MVDKKKYYPAEGVVGQGFCLTVSFPFSSFVNVFHCEES